MTRAASRRWETILVAGAAACISIIAFLFYYRHGWTLLYGDAVAHINIARRVFDSRTPGPLQLGTVWLLMPHLLMIPFLLSHWMWQTGVGGAIPSILAYLAGAVGVFRLVRSALSFSSPPDAAARLTAWFAAGIYTLNPNLIYLQTTAMTEPVYLAFFIWAVLFFTQFVQQLQLRDDDTNRDAQSSLMKSGWCVLGACLTRYDGWFLAVVMCAAGLYVLTKDRARMHRAFCKFVLLAAAGPVFWLAYNGLIYRNPLEFANGPYSARAIEQRTASPRNPPHPGTNNPAVAAVYFLKSAELNVAPGAWGRIWLLLASAGAMLSVLFSRSLWPHLLLCVPLPFYILSVAYGGVPVFLPVWWPYSHYNVRYGLELLPALAVFVALAAYFLAAIARNQTVRVLIASCIVVFEVASYAGVWREQPICFREAYINSRTRLVWEHELAATLKKLPPDSSLLMYLGDHVGALQDAGIPLRRVINEGNHRTWKQPSDPEGLWEKALADPARYVDYVVAIDRDPVALAVKRDSLMAIAEIHANGQPQATIYQTRSGAQPPGSQSRLQHAGATSAR